jgi:hypothetical protein
LAHVDGIDKSYMRFKESSKSTVELVELLWDVSVLRQPNGRDGKEWTLNEVSESYFGLVQIRKTQ